MKDRQLASVIERRKAGKEGYPSDWPIIAARIKALAKWCCERCGMRNNEDAPDGTMLTVHHLDGIKSNVEEWNLAALCQRCHLHIQRKVHFYRVPKIFDWVRLKYYPLTTHSLWMARHIKSYNVWARLNGKREIPLKRIIERTYRWRKKMA